jgi:hypothetical protein
MPETVTAVYFASSWYDVEPGSFEVKDLYYWSPPAADRSLRQWVAPGALVNHECSGHHRSRPSRLVAQIRGIRLSLMMTPGVVQNACRCAPPAPPVVGVAACDAVGAAPGRSV